MKAWSRWTKRGLTVTLLAIAILLVGCSNAQNTNIANNSTPPTEKVEEKIEQETKVEATETKYPITIKHAFGETVIESKPERVATIAWSNHDVALALGIVPVGFSAANYGVQDGSGLLPWTAKKLQELGVTEPNIYQDTAGLDFEAISDSNPDIILAAYSGITQEEYDTLSAIAPVVAYPTTPWVISWRDQIRMNATGLGLAAEGEQLIKDTDKYIADIAAQHPELKGIKAAFTYISAADLSSFYVYSTGDPRGEFLIDLGMEFPESLNPYFKDNSSFYATLSAENADGLNDADIIVAYGNQTLLDALQADPVFSKVPAVKNGAMVLIEDNTPLAAAGTPSSLSIAYTTEQYVELILEAIKKVK